MNNGNPQKPNKTIELETKVRGDDSDKPLHKIFTKKTLINKQSCITKTLKGDETESYFRVDIKKPLISSATEKKLQQIYHQQSTNIRTSTKAK